MAKTPSEARRNRHKKPEGLPDGIDFEALKNGQGQQDNPMLDIVSARFQEFVNRGMRNPLGAESALGDGSPSQEIVQDNIVNMTPSEAIDNSNIIDADFTEVED